jgi:hypothetical protein
MTEIKRLCPCCKIFTATALLSEINYHSSSKSLRPVDDQLNLGLYHPKCIVVIGYLKS